jgi:hypothetical protein
MKAAGLITPLMIFEGACAVSKPKIRYQFELDPALSERLNALAQKPGVTKSSLIAAALESWLNREGSSQLDDRFGIRLNRMSNQLARIERNGHVLLETLALFIRYQLSVTAPLAESDAAARSIGRDRYEAFIRRVGQQLASGKPAIEDVLPVADNCAGNAS